MPPKTVAERVRAHRLKQRAAGETPCAVLSKVRKFLKEYPEQSKAVDLCMRTLAGKVKKASQWAKDHPTGLSTVDGNEDSAE